MIASRDAMPPGFKQCNGPCGLVKPLDDFPLRSDSRDGRRNECKTCKSVRDETYCKANVVRTNARNARNRAAYAADPAPAKAKAKASYAANPEAGVARTKAWREANPERWQEQQEQEAWRHLWRFYRMSRTDYDVMLARQGGMCANPGCGRKPEHGKRLHVDHDHGCCPGQKSCGKCVRGLLCLTCNAALGSLGDSPERVRGLATYITRAGRVTIGGQAGKPSALAAGGFRVPAGRGA